MQIKLKEWAAGSNLNGPTAKKRRFAGMLSLALLASTGGCCLPQIIRSTVQPFENEVFVHTLKWRAARQAKQVWDARFASHYARHACSEDVRDGFVTAYVETALGSDGCPPPVPRTSSIYRTIGHRTPAAIPWYEGYDLGHAAAVSNGVHRWRLLPLDPDLDADTCRPACSPSVAPPVEGPGELAPVDVQVLPDSDPPSYAEPLPPEVDVETLPQGLRLPEVKRPQE